MQLHSVSIPVNNNNQFQLHVYDDGSIEKKYILK